MALDEIIVLRQKLHRQQLEGWKNHYRLEERKGHTWYKNRALIVVGDEGDKRALLEVYHDAPSAGHPGVAKTLQSLSHNYWWPEVKSFVQHYVKECAQCQAGKTKTHPNKPLVQPITPDPQA